LAAPSELAPELHSQFVRRLHLPAGPLADLRFAPDVASLNPRRSQPSARSLQSALRFCFRHVPGLASSSVSAGFLLRSACWLAPAALPSVSAFGPLQTCVCAHPSAPALGPFSGLRPVPRPSASASGTSPRLAPSPVSLGFRLRFHSRLAPLVSPSASVSGPLVGFRQSRFLRLLPPVCPNLR